MWLRNIVFVLLFILAFGATAFYSDVWQAKAFPTPGASVALKDGVVLHGQLSSSWSGDNILILDGGENIQIPLHYCPVV